MTAIRGSTGVVRSVSGSAILSVVITMNGVIIIPFTHTNAVKAADKIVINLFMINILKVRQ